ncbi:MAG: hypothetical protein JW818_18735 [Pirellulales bacterium]|nr:hypothetical protein [Pirellulales bacterium]
MIRYLAALIIVMVMANVASAAVVWDWVGYGFDNVWETPANWSVTGTTDWTYPSEQYRGVAPGEFYNGAPHYAYVNDDVTAININAGIVNKVVDDPENYLLSDALVFGGTDCTMTLDSGSTLTLGAGIYGGAGTTANTTINIQGGSTISPLYSLVGYGGTCTVNINGSGASLAPRNASWLGWDGGTGTIVVDGGTYSAATVFRLGGGPGAIANLEVKNNGLVTVATEFAGGYEQNTQAFVTVNGATLNAGTNNTTSTTLGFWGSTEMTVRNGGNFSTGYHLFAGRSATGNGTLHVQSGGKVNVGMSFMPGYLAGAQGTVTIDGTGSDITAVDSVVVGYAGTGSATVTNGGRLWANGSALLVGYIIGADRGTGTLTLESGGLAGASEMIYFGDGGAGTGYVTDSTLQADLDLQVGYDGTSVGELNIHGTSVVNVGRDFKTFFGGGAAVSGQATSTTHVYSGDVNINGYCALGYSTTTGGSSTQFILDDGTVDIGLAPTTLGDLILGWYDTDANVDLTLNGGLMTVHGALSMGRTTDENDLPITPTGINTGQLRLDIDGGVLQAEDYIDAGTFTDHLITLTDGQLRLLGTEISETDMLALITAGDISCPNGYVISTDGDYTVLESVSVYPPGDATKDGKVDALDARRLAENWLKTGVDWEQGDFNDDDIVDDLDASIMAANWGHGTEAVGAPEPGAAALLLSMAFGWLIWRRK